MKTLLAVVAVLGLLAGHAPGQVDQAKRRAKELVNQNNVRQGVPPPVSQPTANAATTTSKPAATPQQSIAKIQADIASLKPGSPPTAEQKQQFIKDIAVACRGTKPSLPTVITFVNELTSALTDKPIEAAQQSRLAQDVEAVLNSATMTSLKFDDVIADAQAILQVGGVKRNLAISTANSLKAVGLEVRRGSAR